MSLIPLASERLKAMRKFNAITAALLIASTTLSCQRKTSPDAGRVGRVGREEAIRIAEHEAQKIGWNRIEVTHVESSNTNWVISFWGLPKRPGGHGSFFIGTNGNVIAYHPGE
jgi:hypothetical protein